MNMLWLLVLLVFYHGTSSNGVVTNVSNRPDVVNVGAILSGSSIIGKVAKVAIEAAVEDVNSDPGVLSGTKINLTMQDSNFSRFLGIVEGMLFLISIVCFFINHLLFVVFICHLLMRYVTKNRKWVMIFCVFNMS